MNLDKVINNLTVLAESDDNKGFNLKSMPKDDRAILCEDFKIE